MQLATLKSKAPSPVESHDKGKRNPKPFERKERDAPTLLKKLLHLCKKRISSELKEVKGRRKLEEEEDSSIFLTVEPLSPFLRHETHARGSSAPSSVSSITPETQKIFDKMCSEMVIMHTKASCKTTLILRSLSLRNSPLYGSKVTIEEFSTAPKLFNVTIQTKAPVMEAVNAQMAGFMNFLHSKELAFGINRMETVLLSEEDPFKKEKEEKNDLDQDEKRHS